MFPADADARAPQIAADPFGRIWVLASGRLAGMTADGERIELTAALPDWNEGAETLTIDGKGRFWFFRSQGERNVFDWSKAPKSPGMVWAVADAQGLHELPDADTAMGTAPPFIDAAGNVWVMNKTQFVRFAAPFPQSAGAALVKPAPLAVTAAPATPARSWPRRTIKLGGKPYQVYWVEMHNHLKELPNERMVRYWVDRLYLSARYRDGLDAVAITDHDWPEMTRSMYYVEQGIAKVLNTPGRFLAFNGFEWSGETGRAGARHRGTGLAAPYRAGGDPGASQIPESGHGARGGDDFRTRRVRDVQSA